MAPGRAYLILGAYGGVGSALTRILAAEGARVALAGRDEDRLAELAGAVDGVSVPTDARDFAAVEDAVDRAGDEFGRLDGVVNCVGSILLKPAHLTRSDEWQDTVATNLTSAFAVVRAGAGRLSRQETGGAIVLISTAAASIGLPNHEAIAAAKGGVDALVRAAAATYGRQGVRINAVAPGLVETPMTERITGNEKARARSESMHALGRIGTADEVAAAVAWLLSGDADWITGQTLGVDGGLGTVRSA